MWVLSPKQWLISVWLPVSIVFIVLIFFAKSCFVLHFKWVFTSNVFYLRWASSSVGNYFFYLFLVVCNLVFPNQLCLWKIAKRESFSLLGIPMTIFTILTNFFTYNRRQRNSIEIIFFSFRMLLLFLVSNVTTIHDFLFLLFN